jgi:hypothetical protein
MNEKSISNAGTKALHDVIHFLSGFCSALFFFGAGQFISCNYFVLYYRRAIRQKYAMMLASRLGRAH